MARIAYLIIIEPRQSFTHSGDYWHQRYKSGGNSGPGSYHKLADFKAEVLNSFVKDKHITSIIEYVLIVAFYPNESDAVFAAQIQNIIPQIPILFPVPATGFPPRYPSLFHGVLSRDHHILRIRDRVLRECRQG